MKTKQLSNSDFFITPTRFGTSAWEQSLDPIHRALKLLGRISPTAAMVLSVVVVAVIAWFDYVTGDFTLALFYLVPVVLASWNAGPPSVWLFGLVGRPHGAGRRSAARRPSGRPALPHLEGSVARVVLRSLG